MRYGIFSDIHGNLEAFQAVLAAGRLDSIDKFFCLGDIVGYGADPRQCIAMVRELNAITVAGNHDWAVADKFDLRYFNKSAAQSLLWTKDILNDFEKDFLKNLPLQHHEKFFTLAHSSPADPERFNYLSLNDEVLKAFSVVKRRICFVVHTHIPRSFVFKDGKVRLCSESGFRIDPQGLYLCNVGSVGQPRDGSPQAAYVVFDSKKMLVQIKRISYNVVSAQNKIRKAELPEFLATRLSQGR
ncbi:MAG: metallophosphoesterase family protein [Candidatus Omnitrophica bacterium]|nr:metallophosphoesterase family protein [Candidatus Omnitrophota bacterium]